MTLEKLFSFKNKQEYRKGYADGLPRSLSCGNGKVLINGYEAPIIGHICMDQTLVDISDIPNVMCGDIAVIIGKSGILK